MILTSRRVSADEGRRLGFVNEVVPQDRLEEIVQGYCEDILKGAPPAIRASKATAYQSLTEPDLETAQNNQENYTEFAAWRQSDDAMEGINAFIEKRKPEWTGQ